VSPDGTRLVFMQRTRGGTFDLWMLPLVGDRTPSPLFQTPFTERNARFSPDGRFLAYLSDESSSFEVFVSPFPFTGEKVRVSSGGGTSPRWSRDGRELFYASDARQLVAVPIRTTPSLQLGAPVTLFPLKGSRPWIEFDVSVDGKTFLASVPEISANQQPLTAVVNWTSEVRR